MGIGDTVRARVDQAEAIYHDDCGMGRPATEQFLVRPGLIDGRLGTIAGALGPDDAGRTRYVVAFPATDPLIRVCLAEHHLAPVT